MTVDVVVNSYVTRAQADTYLADSARAATKWTLVAGTAKDRAIISAFRELDRETWDGVATGVDYAASAVVDTGGVGYAIGDVVELVGGDGAASRFKVATVTGGVVDTVTVEELGGYSTTPANPAATAKVTGGGDDALTLTVTYLTQTADFPRSGLRDRQGVALDSQVIPTDIDSAQIELAFEISQNTSVEGGSGTGSNTKRLKAGSAEIEFFKGTDGTPFPTIVNDLIAPFLGSSTGTSGSAAFGVCDESQFDDADTFKKTEAFP